MLDQVNKERMMSQQMVDTNKTGVLAPEIKTCVEIEGLADIKETDTELVIYRRTLASGLNDWIQELSPSVLPHLRIFAAPEDVPSALNPMLDACGMPKNSMRKLLISDITELAFAFSQITESKRVDLRLEHIKNDACWRFHIDYVEVRLLTTYLGATTEWVQPAYANQAIKQQRKFLGPLEHLDINDVAIFKGKSSSQTNGIVHRSPPLAGTGVSRLLLALNKQSELTPAPWDNS